MAVVPKYKDEIISIFKSHGIEAKFNDKKVYGWEIKGPLVHCQNKTFICLDTHTQHGKFCIHTASHSFGTEAFFDAALRSIIKLIKILAILNDLKALDPDLVVEGMIRWD